MRWEMHCGRLPFPGKNQTEMMNSHLYAPQARPRDIGGPRLRSPALPEALEDLMVALVAPPQDRLRTAYELRTQFLALARPVWSRPTACRPRAAAPRRQPLTSLPG